MNSTGRTRKRTLSRLRDYVLYILIGFVLTGAGMAVELKLGRADFIRWGGLTVYTAILFGLFIQESKQFVRVTRFWILMAALLVVHLTAFVILLLLIKDWRLMWFMVMAFEYPVFLYLRSCFAHPSG